MATASPTSATTGLVALPRLPDHPVASAEHPETLFGLAEKFVAAESTVFLAKQLSALLPVLLGFLPEEEQALVQEYKEKVRSLQAELQIDSGSGAIFFLLKRPDHGLHPPPASAGVHDSGCSIHPSRRHLTDDDQGGLGHQGGPQPA